MASTSSGLNSSPPNPQGKYDLFLNFGEEDTGTSFAAHLFKAFGELFIITRRNNLREDRLEAEENRRFYAKRRSLGAKLRSLYAERRSLEAERRSLEAERLSLKAERQTFNNLRLLEIRRRLRSLDAESRIQNSRTAITILGENYASSSWALDELELILKSHGKRKTVLPIFYNVDPSDVRNQTGSFAEAFARHEETYKDDPDKVRRWRAALTQVANLSGWDSRGRHEAELIKDIVDDIRKKLHPVSPSTNPFSSILAKISTPFSSPFSSKRRKYDVFMCFRGKDTRLNFVDHMFKSLEQNRITTFRDDKSLERGLSISSGLETAIATSQISLVTLSENFASSTWCLDELVKIVECTKTSNLQRILEAFTENEEAWADMAGINKCNTRDRKISKVRILVRYDGEWVNTAYNGGKAKEIVVSKDITFEELLRRVYRLVGIDCYEYEIIMKTTDESKSPAQPVQIVDDEDLAFFIEQSQGLDKSSKVNIPKPRISSSRTRRKMNKLGLLVNYDGKWSNSIYIGGKTKGITVSDSITYEELVQKLYNAHGVDPSEFTIIVTTAYGSKLPTRPVELIDDDDLTFFIDESLSLDEGSKIPLCITLQLGIFFLRLLFFSFLFCCLSL